VRHIWHAEIGENLEQSRTDRQTSISPGAAGLHEPGEKVYLSAERFPELPATLALFVFSSLPRYVASPALGVLERRQKKQNADVVPLALGVATLLRQFHPSYTTVRACFAKFCRGLADAPVGWR
jgi:Hereditary spastic paraplegia protein strumpellin